MNKKLIIVLLLIAAIVIIAGCVSNAPARPEQTITWTRTSDPFDNKFNSISVVHDDKVNVTCWVLTGSGISCIPDSQLNLSK